MQKLQGQWDMIKLAFGCSHTYGLGVERNEAWPFLLDAINLGKSGVSVNYIARILPSCVELYKPSLIYILWPDYTRFEYEENGIIHQSLPTDKNRIKFMEMANDEWLWKNYNQQVDYIKSYCISNKIKLIDMTLLDLAPFIDFADKWPLSKLGHHYSEEWHKWVADIFASKQNEQV